MKAIVALFLGAGLLLFCAPGFADEIDRFLASRKVVGQIYFAKQDSRLSDEHQAELAGLLVTLRNAQQSGRLIRIEGFASPDGQEAFNLDLSLRRAVAVKSYLEQNGFPAELFLTGFGEISVSNGKLSQQRRVDIVTYENNAAAIKLFKKTGQAERYQIK